MDRDYYRSYFILEREHWWFRARARILSDIIRHRIHPREPLKILNVGAATGQSSIWLSEFGNVKSVEYDEETYRLTKEKLDLDIIQASILELPFEDDSFDLVCAFDVIEHVQDDRLAACELVRVCKPGGHVFVSVPAFQFLWSHHDEVNHHYRRYTLRKLRNLFPEEAPVSFGSYFNFYFFLPILAFRLLVSWWWPRPENASDFEGFQGDTRKNRLMERIFASESGYLSKKGAFPFGVSALLLSRKEDGGESRG